MSASFAVAFMFVISFSVSVQMIRSHPPPPPLLTPRGLRSRTELNPPPSPRRAMTQRAEGNAAAVEAGTLLPSMLLQDADSLYIA